MKSTVAIHTFRRNGITYLKECFASNPFKVMDVRENKTQPCLELMLMSSSPGILDGDHYTFQIDVKENCALSLHTQSYQRIYNMKTSAVQNTTINVGENGFFQYLPHPTVPHKDSNFLAKNDIYLSTRSTLIWCDLFSCGRKLNGESFDYNSFENSTTIYQNNTPVAIEHICFQPKSQMPTSLGQLEDYSHSGSIFIINENINIKTIKQKADDILNQFEGIEFGTSLAPTNGLIIKLLANGGEHLFQITKTVVKALKLEIEN